MSPILETVLRPHGRNLVVWAATRPEVVVLSADLTGSCEANDFRAAYPARFFSLGMAEQNMMGFAAGLAREGFTPFVHTFGVFITRRPFDQVAMSIAYPNLRVRLLGFLPGITTPGGATHQAIEDLALMRALPNMTVLCCGDATEVESALSVAQAVDGPVYLRMLRRDVPRLFPTDEPMVLNQARILAQDHRGSEEICLLTCGICTLEAMKVTTPLRASGVSIHHLHVSTLKPFSDPQVLAGLRRARRAVITLENHSIIGGLGSAVAECMAEAGVGVPLVRLGLQDTFAHGASRQWLMREYGLDAAALLATVERLVGRQLGLTAADLGSPSPASVAANDAAPEAL